MEDVFYTLKHPEICVKPFLFRWDALKVRYVNKATSYSSQIYRDKPSQSRAKDPVQGF